MKKIFCLLIIISLMINPIAAEAKDYSEYSVAKHEWGLGLNTNHEPPENSESVLFKKRNAHYYVHTKKKKIYLTFDCGYENGYTSKILDILKRKKIKAMFFVTKTYIRDNKKLVKRMKKEGHLVGNHTVTHPSLPACSVSKIKSEIFDTEKYMKEETGYEMDKFIRPPMGEWSEQSLEVTKDLGYKTVFWSMAFYDYDIDNQPGKQKIIDSFMKYYHKGAIVLMHGISSSDTYALSSIVRNMRQKGYDFYELTDLKDKV